MSSIPDVVGPGRDGGFRTAGAALTQHTPGPYQKSQREKLLQLLPFDLDQLLLDHLIHLVPILPRTEPRQSLTFINPKGVIILVSPC